MGTGIAAAALSHQVSVRLFDVDAAATRRAATQLRGLLDDAPAATPPTLGVCAGQDELATCPLVLESVVEDPALKQDILAALAANMAPDAVLASNTSTIPIAQLATRLPCPDRFCGLHFCNPVAERRLVEVIRGPATSPSTIATAARFVAGIGKLPVVVEDCPGFLVNRLLLPYINEALEMVCQGGDIQLIDQSARDFGMALGPLEMLDMMGTDVAYRAGKMMWQAAPSRVSLTPVLPALVKRKRLGQKTGVGFYQYATADGAPQRDEALAQILDPYLRHTRTFTAQEICARLFLPMLLEAVRVIEDGIVTNPRDVDLAAIHGLAFPAARGGPLYWADTIGWEPVLELIQPLEPLGQRMAPPALLVSLARSNSTIYDLPV